MFYTKNIETTLSNLDTSTKGLSTHEAQKRNEEYGKNSLTSYRKDTLFTIFVKQFKSPIIYILLIAAIVSFAIEEFTDASFIMAVLFINAFIGTYQEYSAVQKADALKKIIKTFVMVLRDDKKVELLHEDVTIGDIVYFESGVKVPADIRLIETNKLFANESLLTGESIDVSKDANALYDEVIPIGDRQNMLYAGSIVTKGRATGVVTQIGDQTQLGKIASLVTSETTAKAPLLLRIERFSLNISKVIALVIALIFLVGIYQETPLKEIFFFTVALAVSAIPEGLPVAITVALGVASIAMSKRNVIIRKLSAVEGLGSCTLIASDKTGTMTQNQLSVEYFVTPNKTFDLHENIDERALQCAFLCNEVTFIHDENNFEFLGDQVDVALARYALKRDEKLINLKEKITLVDNFSYEPENKYSAMSYRINDEKTDYIKGSPEVILNMCGLLSSKEEDILNQVKEWAAKGFRNIALAYKVSDEEGIAKDNYIYLGFASIMDPLREGVKKSVSIAKQAGVKVVMITGDHPNTAFFIAKELEIANNEDEIIDGTEISKWQERGSIKEGIGQKTVFARISPEQKRLIIQAFQELGHFVAVTGDGVNDAPALKSANIGISMGKSGTDVARESSDLILTDDAFSSIVNGIEEGRIVYNNIRKVVHLLISTGFAEIVLIMLSMLFFIPIPLLPVQLLWLNLVTNGIQHVALSFEKAEDGILQQKPRDPKERIFNKVMISRIIVGGLYMGVTAFVVFYTLLQYGYSEETARNITLLLMVLFENVHVFNSRSETNSLFKMNHLKNKFLWISVIIAQGVHIISMYSPLMQTVLNVQPVDFKVWLTLLLIALVLVVIMEFEKVIRKKIEGRML